MKWLIISMVLFVPFVIIFQVHPITSFILGIPVGIIAGILDSKSY